MTCPIFRVTCPIFRVTCLIISVTCSTFRVTFTPYSANSKWQSILNKDYLTEVTLLLDFRKAFDALKNTKSKKQFIVLKLF